MARRLSPFLLCLALLACNRPEPSQDADAVRTLVDAFGGKLRMVSLLAPPDVLASSMREHYGPFVTPALLERWIADPAQAPGRKASSPWPARIEIAATRPTGEGLVTVRGELVEVTSETAGSERRTPVELVTMRHDGQWRITQFMMRTPVDAAPPSTTASQPPASTETTTPSGAPQTASASNAKLDTDTADAVAVIENYYHAINQRQYEQAHRLWSGEGAASGQSLEAFRNGFSDTVAVEVHLGTPGRIEGAAGSRFLELPVEIVSRTTVGTTQRFHGKYVLRRSVVDGATAEQRQWRIHSAEIAPAR